MEDRARTIERLLRDLAKEVLRAVVRRYRDFAACEDAVQEALLAASESWNASGIPDDPRAWLIRVAGNKVTDEVRRESARRRREQFVVSLVPEEVQFEIAQNETSETVIFDETLELFFTCCHADLSPTSAIALTLRAVGGLTTKEIAAAFMVPETTMAQRISRAKETIRSSATPFATPNGAERTARTNAVLHVLYLVFNEGYATSAGSSLQRVDLSTEAIRLTRAVSELVGDVSHAAAETQGLLALMLLTHARRHARTGTAGELIPLDEQDRALWDRDAIAQGTEIITRTFTRGAPGPYQLQAAIAALHDEAPSTEATDWAEIRALYDVLLEMTKNPMVALNRAIAVAMVEGPRVALGILDELSRDDRLRDHHRLAAVRGHFHEKLGEHAEAIAFFTTAAERTASIPERDYLRILASRISEKMARSPRDIERS